MTKLKLQDLAARAIDVELHHPVSNEPIGVSIRVVGKNSRQFKNKFYETVALAEKDLKEATKADQLKIAEQRSVELIAACVVGWEDQEFFGGPYTPERAFELLVQPELAWVKDQLEKAIVEDSSFFVGLPAT